MIDPVNPGPAGTFGPAGAASGASAPGDLTPLLTSGSAVISQAMQAVTGAVQSLFNQAFATVQGAIAKAAGSISAGYNAAETQLVTSGAQAQAAISSQVQSATVQSGGGGTSESGVNEGQYGWNVYSYIIAPYPARAVQGVGIPGAQMQLWCFRGSWDNGQDAVRYSLGIGGSAPPPGCLLPGGPAAPPGNPPAQPAPCTGYTSWQRINADGTGTCIDLCDGVQAPSGFVAGATGQRFDALPGPPGTLYSCFVAKPPVPPQQYYGGCSPTGQPVSWQAGTPAPAGVTGQVGPFGDSTSALSAASCPTGGGPPGGPPPSSGTGTGICPTCNSDGSLKLPDCIDIDLCSPEKVAQAIYMGMCKWSTDDSCFYDPIWRAIKKGLCEWIKDPACECPLTDSVKYQIEGCNPVYDNLVKAFMGQAGAVVTDAGSLDEVVQQALDLNPIVG